MSHYLEIDPASSKIEVIGGAVQWSTGMVAYRAHPVGDFWKIQRFGFLGDKLIHRANGDTNIYELAKSGTGKLAWLEE